MCACAVQLPHSASLIKRAYSMIFLFRMGRGSLLLIAVYRLVYQHSKQACLSWFMVSVLAPSWMLPYKIHDCFIIHVVLLTSIIMILPEPSAAEWTVNAHNLVESPLFMKFLKGLVFSKTFYAETRPKKEWSVKCALWAICLAKKSYWTVLKY